MQIVPEYGKHYAPGYIGFSYRDHSLISAGVSWFTSLHEVMEFSEALGGKQPSHVFIVKDKETLYEAAERGVVVSKSLQKRINDPALRLVFRKPLGFNYQQDIPTLIQMFNFLDSKVGEPYDYTALLGGWPLAIMTQVERIIPFISRFPLLFQMPFGWFCSELAAACLKATHKYKGDEFFKKNHLSWVSPVRLWNHGPLSPLRLEEETK